MYILLEMNNLAKHHRTFENIRKKTKEGIDFWSARDLQIVLDYKSWDKFKSVISKAIKSCEISGNSQFDHFSQVGKMVQIGSDAECYIENKDIHNRILNSSYHNLTIMTYDHVLDRAKRILGV